MSDVFRLATEGHPTTECPDRRLCPWHGWVLDGDDVHRPSVDDDGVAWCGTDGQAWPCEVAGQAAL